MVAATAPHALASDAERMLRAIDARDAQTIGTLLANGADANAEIVSRERHSMREKRAPILIHAVRRGCVDCVRTLLDAGAKVNAPTTPDADTALHAAADLAVLEVLELLARHGADPNVQDALGITPLHVAARGASPAVLKALLGRGADVNARSAEGTPLMVAVRANRDGAHVSHIRILVGAKADPNIADRSEYPLHAAISNPPEESYERVISGLVRAGARTDVRNARGETPAELAARLGRADALKRALAQR